MRTDFQFCIINILFLIPITIAVKYMPERQKLHRSFQSQSSRNSLISPKYTLFDPIDGTSNFQFLENDFNQNNYYQCGTRSVKFNLQRNGRIIGGEEVPYGAFPWQAEIQLFSYNKRKFQHHCGGALISERIVITAAHCLQVAQLEYLRIVFGNHFLMQKDLYEHGFRVDDTFIHPDYRKYGPYSNDVGLIKIRAPHIPFNTHIKSICLPDIDESPAIGSWCSVAGWGAHDVANLENIATSLRAASVPILDINVCRNANVNGGRDRNQKILDSMICAGFLDGGVDSCNGDSGGPLVCERNGIFFLNGIVSFGEGCAKKNRPGIYTKVSAYIHWIRNTMQQFDIL